jgi:GAF domain-containing protein
MTYTAVYGRLAEILSGRVKLLSDEGFCTWVLRHKQEFYSDDLATDGRRIESEEMRKRLGVRTVISTPMFFKGEIIGALTVVNRLDGSLFTRADLEERLRPLANQAAIAIQNARLFEQTQASLHELDTLYRLHTREEWKRVSRERAQVPGYHYSPTGVSPAGEDWWPEIREAARRGETRTLSGDGGEMLTTPITLRGQAIGALSFRRPEEAGAWSAQDAALMEATADQVALALENVRLMQESRQWAQREFTIREIGDKVSASFDLDTILRTTVEELSAPRRRRKDPSPGPFPKRRGERHLPLPLPLRGRGLGCQVS